MVTPDAHPGLIPGHVEDAVRDRLAHGIGGEIVNTDFLRLSFGLPLASTVLEPSNQLFLLCVDGNHRLVPRLEVFYRGIDVLKLRVAVRVIRAFTSLAQGMEAVTQRVELAADAGVADLESVAPQLDGQIAGALAGPPQRRHGVPSRRRRHHSFQRLDPPLLSLDQRLPTSAGTTLTINSSAPALQLRAASPNGCPGQPGRARHDGVASVSDAPRFCCRPQSSRPLIKQRLEREIFPSDRSLDVQIAPHDHRR
jgi:hypothetical protein